MLTRVEVVLVVPQMLTLAAQQLMTPLEQQVMMTLVMPKKTSAAAQQLMLTVKQVLAQESWLYLYSQPAKRQ